MSESWGGARTPSAPAVVSGPGAMSARTDGGVMNPAEPEYGERQALENLTSAAPTASGASASAGVGSPVDMLAGITPLGAGTQMPDEPITAGAARGAGPGVEALGLPTDQVGLNKADAKAIPPGQKQALIAAAGRADATPSFRKMVRQVLASS